MLAVRVEALESSAGVTVGANREVHGLPRSGGIGVLGVPRAGYVELFVCAPGRGPGPWLMSHSATSSGALKVWPRSRLLAVTSLGGVVNHADVFGEFLELLW